MRSIKTPFALPPFNQQNTRNLHSNETEPGNGSSKFMDHKVNLSSSSRPEPYDSELSKLLFHRNNEGM